MTIQTHLPPQWKSRLLAVVNAQAVVENLRFLDAWAKAEGGDAKWNPLNTTYPLLSSWAYNSSKVQNYAHATDGICATAITLVQSYYVGILGDLQAANKTAESIVERNRAEIQVWGTNPDTILAVLKGV